jgi:hypothetical protein
MLTLPPIGIVGASMPGVIVFKDVIVATIAGQVLAAHKARGILVTTEIIDLTAQAGLEIVMVAIIMIHESLKDTTLTPKTIRLPKELILT